jgi:chorismate lyase/3-hydroxybenzoate synthase
MRPKKDLTGKNILGAVNYTSQAAGPRIGAGFPELDVHMADDENERFAEVWITEEQTSHGERDGIGYAHDGEYFFCAGLIPRMPRYTEATRAAYVTMFELLGEFGYDSVFRMWNFVEDINGDNGEGREVYRDFCRGRAEAFEQCAVEFDQFPAATGIGSLGGGIGFYLLACRSGGHVNIENPQQVPAYHYPRRYGPRSPRFARATHVPCGSGQIYVSGTTSVLGHETVRAGQIEAQCRLALENIALLISRRNLAASGIDGGADLTDLTNIKVYVRHRDDIDIVRELCAEAFAPWADIALLNVDICRADLLVEIEGIVA